MSLLENKEESNMKVEVDGLGAAMVRSTTEISL